MKISTWNLERPTKNGKKTPPILECLKAINADILILTETNDFIDLGAEYTSYHTEIFPGEWHKEGDRQVSIFSKFPIINRLPTFRSDTSICITVDSSFGEVTIYGTVIGNFGNRGDQFQTDLDAQIADWKKIGAENNLIIAGDLNISFSDNTYFTRGGREKLLAVFKELKMRNMTGQISQNIDHIIMTEAFIQNKKAKIEFWNDTENITTRLSDHKGVYVELWARFKVISALTNQNNQNC